MMKEKDKGVKINDDLRKKLGKKWNALSKVEKENFMAKSKESSKQYSLQKGVVPKLFYHEHISFEEKFLPLYTRPSPRITAWGDDEVLDRKRRLKKLGGYANENVINLEASKLNYFERQFIGIRSIRCYLPTTFSQMILCGSPHPFFDRKTSIVSKYISELDDCEKLFIPMHDECPGHWYLCVIDFKNSHIQILDSLRSKNRDKFRFQSVKTVVEFCQTFFKLYDIGKDVFQFSIDWAPSIPT
eukprot:XP_019080473.1 PREDICTED: uncharacterized protein LOC104881558 [Vitis vinifera]